MKNEIKLKKAFGVDDDGYLAIYQKISGTKISRVLVGEIMGCSRCFPHGIETKNSKYYKTQRSWKKYRASQYK